LSTPDTDPDDGKCLAGPTLSFPFPSECEKAHTT